MFFDPFLRVALDARSLSVCSASAGFTILILAITSIIAAMPHFIIGLF